MDDWENNNDFIQRLDFSSCGEEGEDRSINEEDTLSSSPIKHCDFQKWNSPLPATPHRKLSEIFLSRTKSWVSPTLKSSPGVSRTHGNAETPLHITWKKLQLCDTPHTPKVMVCVSVSGQTGAVASLGHCCVCNMGDLLLALWEVVFFLCVNPCWPSTLPLEIGPVGSLTDYFLSMNRNLCVGAGSLTVSKLLLELINWY